jgi:hypothetical protein
MQFLDQQHNILEICGRVYNFDGAVLGQPRRLEIPRTRENSGHQ